MGAGGAGVLLNAGLSFPFHVVPTAAAFWIMVNASAHRREAGAPQPPRWTPLAWRLAVAAVLLAIPLPRSLEDTAVRVGQAAAVWGGLDPAPVRRSAGAQAVA